MTSKTTTKQFSVSFNKGYYPSSGLVGEESIPGSIIDGSNMLILGPGLIRAAQGLGAGEATIVGGDRLYLADDQVGTVRGKGSIIPYRRKAYFFISDGPVYLGGLLISATGSAGVLQYYLNTNVYNAGLSAPPRLEDPNKNPAALYKIEPTATGITSGAVSIRYTKFRTTTGEESSGSAASDSINVNAQKIKLTLPSVPATTNADSFDAYKIYATLPGQGNVGDHFYLQTAMVGAGASSPVVIIDYQAKDVVKTLDYPINRDVPPVGQYVAALGPYIIVIGTEGGTGIAVSDGVNLGAFPADNKTFLNPLEPVVGLAARPQEGELIVWTANSLQGLLFTGEGSFPVYSRAIWPSMGIQSPHGGCFADSQFYAFISDMGAVRLGNDSNPDASFSLPVRQYFKDNNWKATGVVVGYDPENNAVVYMYGNKALAYMRDLDIWSPPITLNTSGSAKAAVTYHGKLQISMDNAIAKWEGGGQTPMTAFFTPAWNDEPTQGRRKTIRAYRIVGKAATLKADLLVDFSTSPAPLNGTLTDSVSALPRYTQWKRTNTKCRAYTIKFTLQNSNEEIYGAEIELTENQELKDAF